MYKLHVVGPFLTYQFDLGPILGGHAWAQDIQSLMICPVVASDGPGGAMGMGNFF